MTGGVYFGGTLYWTAAVLRTYGDLAVPVAVFACAALVAYLALYPALFAVLVDRVVAWLGARGLLLAPALWVTTELGRSHLFTGFPWVLAGYSQATVLPIAQLASLFGVYGLSALVALTSATLAYLAFASGRGPAIALAITIAVVGVTAGWGERRLAGGNLDARGTPITVGLVQGNVPQDQKWDPERAAAIFRRYLALSREAAARGSKFIIWPESSTPFYFEEDPVGGAAVRGVAADAHAWMLVGSDQIERGKPDRFYNAAFLVGPDGRTLAVYRKIHLVPFGEYVPLKRLLFFIGPLVESVSDFSAGDQAVLLPVDGHLASTAICYEVVYPELMREFTEGGSQLLTTITNDAWYGRSSAPYQHFQQASLRAIEEGRYLVRSANTGISGIVDPYGRVLARSQLFEQTVLVGQARFLTDSTVYAAIGDLFADLCAVLTALALIGSMMVGRRQPRVELVRRIEPGA